MFPKARTSKVWSVRERLERLTTGRFDGAYALDYPGAGVGVVTSGVNGRDAEALRARADAAIYEPKKAREALSSETAWSDSDPESRVVPVKDRVQYTS